MLRQQLTDGAHELAPRVNLKELRPPQWAPLVNPSQAIDDICRSLASQGLSFLVAAGDVNDHESITEGIPSNADVWQEERVGLVNLVWHRNVKLWPGYVPRSREVDQPDGLLLEQILGLRDIRWPPVPSSNFGDCSKYWPGWRTAFYLAPSRSARYFSSPISLHHAEATGP